MIRDHYITGVPSESVAAVMAERDRFASVAKSASFAVTMRQALQQGQPGAWANDHREESLHFTGWNYVAAHAVAKQCSQATVEISRPKLAAAPRGRLTKSHGQGNQQDSEPLPDDDRFVRLLKRPNPRQSGASFRYEASVQLSLTGTALIWIVRNQLGLPVEIYLIPTALAQPMPPSREYPMGAYRMAVSLWYTDITVDDGYAELNALASIAGKVVDAREFVTVRWPHPLAKDDGYSPLAAGSLPTDTAEQIDRSRFSHLKNGINPSVAISPDKDTSPSPEEIERVQTTIAQKYGGPNNSGRAMIVPGGSTVTPLSNVPKDMDYSAGFDQMSKFILALHGVPGVAVGMGGDGSYAAFYAALKQMSVMTVQPQLNLLAEELQEQLGPFFGETLTVTMTAPKIDDENILEEQLRTDITAQCITKNELRALRGLPPHADGDVWAGQQPQAPAVPSDPFAAFGGGQSDAQETADETTTGVEGLDRNGFTPPVIGSNGKSHHHNGVNRINGNGHHKLAAERLARAANLQWGEYP